MKVAVLHSYTDIRIEDWRIPEVEAGEALIQMKACGICSGDVMPWYIEKKAPLVLGHEPAGRIVALGEGAPPRFKVGDMVFVHHHAPCMKCRHCKKGDHVLCETWKRSRIIPGGLAEYVKIPKVNLERDTLVLPKKVGYLGGVMVEPLACVVKGIRRMTIEPGDRVLVIGLGIMGMLFVVLAKHYGASKVIGVDMNQYRLAKALDMGATDVVDITEENAKTRIDKLTGGDGADKVVIGPGSIPAMAQGIACAGPGSTVLFFTPTPPGDILKIDQNRLYFNEVSLVQSYSCGPDDTREALKLLASGVIPIRKLITHQFPLSEAAEAFRLTSKAGESLKAVVVF
ncbi:MAG: alcohol dehydrogenase catalytic domain-containing protein [Nitrospirae bacterium]|nr:alcohol dehydrogenase catalytic domain-containing protein [Nitrospirota bacterium]MBI5696579.1 alcohol dehydrogenase catalytic domain-containing protein [Nitrospirota bacterium]